MVNGQVDVVNDGTYSIECSGKCVDLDGTPGPGGISSDWTAFVAGQTMTSAATSETEWQTSSVSNSASHPPRIYWG